MDSLFPSFFLLGREGFFLVDVGSHEEMRRLEKNTPLYGHISSSVWSARRGTCKACVDLGWTSFFFRTSNAFVGIQLMLAYRRRDRLGAYWCSSIKRHQ